MEFIGFRFWGKSLICTIINAKQTVFKNNCKSCNYAKISSEMSLIIKIIMKKSLFDNKSYSVCGRNVNYRFFELSPKETKYSHVESVCG